MKKPPFLNRIKQIHFTGIKGVGMTALALCSQDLGIKISGSDVKETFVTDEVLKKRKIRWKAGFNPDHLKPKPDLLITTGAHGGFKNPEVLAAKKMKIPIFSYGEAVGKFMEGKDGVSVCGVGGKTTTSSMVATVLDYAKRQPSFSIGVASINPVGFAGRYTNGQEFVTEADEYVNSPGSDDRPKFFFQNPRVVALTNIEYDHPDAYPSLKETKEVFLKFFKKIPKNGLLVASIDNPNNQAVLAGYSGLIQTYGFSPRADWRIEKVYFGQGQTIFSLHHQGLSIDDIKIKVPGKFNVLNAAATFAVANFLGVDGRQIKAGLAKFGGSKRRFELIAEVNSISLYDDYAHHPEEIKATLKAAKLWFPQRRLVIIFQPHTYSRIKALLKEFGRAFSLADLVIITDIYASAREKPDSEINSQILSKEIKKHHRQVVYQPGVEEVGEFLKREKKANDVIMTMGAGDIFQWHKTIRKSLKS